MAQAAELLNSGPGVVSPRGAAQRARRAVTKTLARALRPVLAHQHALDEAILAGVLAAVARLQNLEHDLILERELNERQDEQVECIGAVVEELVATAESLRRRIAHNEPALAGVHRLRAGLQAVPYVADNPFEQFDVPVGEVTGFRSLRSLGVPKSQCAGLEDLFRGPPDRVTELQRPYVEIIEAHQPVLHIGCGRGEFLALLASRGIVARGVDSRPGMVERCREQGLHVGLGDGSEHLESLDDETVGTVFCAQVIEHLTADQLRRVLELSRRKLAPGGLFIAETVNPHSIPALKTFWVDLTHQHPVFPEVALALCALAGFGSAYVFAPGYSSFEQARFAATSYAVVAASPAPPSP